MDGVHHEGSGQGQHRQDSVVIAKCVIDRDPIS